MPQPADSSDGSAVARWAAQEKIGVDRRRQLAEELGEGPVVLEGQHARPNVGGRLARGGPREPVVPGHGALDLQAGGREREPVAHREREPERIGLDAAVVEQLRPDGEAHHAARHRDGLEAAVAGHRVHERSRRGEQVRAVVQPVVAARIGAQAPAEPVSGLQQQHVAVAQAPRRRQPGDASADHHDVAFGHGEHHPRASLQAGFDCLAESKAELLSLQQVRCFCAALELGSFSAAADALRCRSPLWPSRSGSSSARWAPTCSCGPGAACSRPTRASPSPTTPPQSLRALEDAADSVGEFTAMRSGRVALGTFSAPRRGGSRRSWPPSWSATRT